jgi:hypothetical protein
VLVAFAVAGLVGLSMNFAAEALGRILKQYKGSVMVCLAIVISLEMMFYARHFIAVKPAPESRHDAGLLKILAQDREPYRVLTNFGVWVPARDSFDFDAGMNYRVFNATGYDPSILRSYYEYIDMANGNTPGASILDHDVQIPYLNVYSRATDFLNIKYILHPRAYDPLYGTVDGRFRLVREDRVRDWRLYENTAVKPRFFFDGAGRVSITRYSPNEIVLTADTPSGDMLQSSEVFYPGWEGYVDGKKTDIIKSNHAFRSLFVPAGNHTVIYRFNPRIFVIAALVSAVSVGLAFFLLNLRSFPGP